MNNLFKKKRYLYLITPSNLLTKKLPLKKYLEILNNVLKTKKVKFLQLRLKNKSRSQILEALKKISFLCKKNKTILFINDYVDDNFLNFCDGVHLGQKDLSKKKINKIFSKKKFLGVTCHNSKNLAKKALGLKPNYISFGSFFKTNTKKIKYKAKVENIDWFKKNFSLPCAAIGGIRIENCEKILKTKCNLLAVSAGVWDYKKGPIKAIKLFHKILNKNHENFSK